jgi:hypothetical protein
MARSAHFLAPLADIAYNHARQQKDPAEFLVWMT